MKRQYVLHCLLQTRYGARVAPQRCTILHIGKAVAIEHFGCQWTPLKTKVVLDIGYTSLCDSKFYFHIRTCLSYLFAVTI